MKTVDFSCVTIYGVILLCPSGVLFSTQASGTGCSHPCAEGVFIPTAPCAIDEDEYHDHLCGDGMNDTEADMCDAVFRGMRYPFVVDRSRFKEAREAWIPVVLNHKIDEFDPLAEFAGTKGFFIYPNCD